MIGKTSQKALSASSSRHSSSSLVHHSGSSVNLTFASSATTLLHNKCSEIYTLDIINYSPPPPCCNKVLLMYQHMPRVAPRSPTTILSLYSTYPPKVFVHAPPPPPPHGAHSPSVSSHHCAWPRHIQELCPLLLLPKKNKKKRKSIEFEEQQYRPNNKIC